jgi:hypothetical protein
MHYFLLTESVSDGGVHHAGGGDELDLVEIGDEKVVTDVAEAVLPRRGTQQTLDQPDKQDNYGTWQGRKLLQGTLLKGKLMYMYMYMEF